MKTPGFPNTKLDRKGVLMKTEESVLKAKLTYYLYQILQYKSIIYKINSYVNFRLPYVKYT